MTDFAQLEIEAERLQRKYREERDRRLRTEGNEQYIGIEGTFSGLGDDPHCDRSFTRPAETRDVDVAIVGGGFSGLLAASACIKAGIDNICIIEKGGDFGGTWYWNRYPGCQCDVEAYSYLPLIEDHGDMPTLKYAPQPQILEHARKIARELDLYKKGLVQTGVTEVRWDEPACRWQISTDRGDIVTARFVAMASGILSRPKLPGIPGIETFKGHSFHSSRWDYAYTGGNESGGLDKLRDKRVAIIGTGASAAQAIPHLGAAARQLYVVQRTPAALDARDNRPTEPDWWQALQPGWWEKRARNFEGFLLGMPQSEDLIQDGWTRGWGSMSAAAATATSPEEQKRQRQLADYAKMESIRNRIDAIVEDEETAEALKPWFNWMCKRPLFVDGYYETFNRPTVKLIDTRGKGLDSITEGGIVFDGVEYPVDCIIFASGFEVAAATDRAGSFKLVGADGRTLPETWAAGMRTLHGMMTRNFPNAAIINGLKQASITWNITFMMRRQSEHFAAVVKRCLDAGIDRIEVTDAAQESWLDTLRAKSSVDQDFLRDCTPGYYNNEGRNQDESIWVSSYGGGPFEYMELLDEWRAQRFDADLDRRPA